MGPRLESLLAALLRAVPVALDTEESAIELVMRTRWPLGRTCPRCQQRCTRDGARLFCACRRRCTIFIGTPLQSLRAPRVRGLLLGLRAMVLDHRGIGARPLAERLDIPHVTLWRHLHLLRALLPEPSPLEGGVSEVLVCGRKGLRMATILAGARGISWDVDVFPMGRRVRRLVAESVRTWLNGTFHGVTAAYIPSYAREAAARARGQPADTLHAVLTQLV